MLVLYLGAIFALYQLLLWPLAVRDCRRPLRAAAAEAGIMLVRRPAAAVVLGLALLAVNLVGLARRRPPLPDDDVGLLRPRGDPLRLAATPTAGGGIPWQSVTFEHVWKRYDRTLAVKDFSLEIADGEFIVLVGPSGCGKSTALRMVAGLERITEGRILIGDSVVNNLAPAARDVAMVFQSYALYPHMIVYDNLAFGLRNQGLPKREIDERVRRAAEILQLAELLKRKPKQLSGGQRQRVALGRAIVREPAVFLMDEPLSNLDASCASRRAPRSSSSSERLGTTTIYVTHDQVEAMTMGDRIVVMDQGILQQVGTAEEVYKRPQNTFVAASSARRR